MNKEFEKLTNILIDFFEDINYFVCPRCSPKDWTQENYLLLATDVQKLPSDLPKEYGHHIGEINTILKSNKTITNEWIDNFYNDTEHGFFHGLMVSFIMYLINLDSNNPIELRPEHYVSTILHDFLKSNGVAQELHDKLLVNYFDKLLEETYEHSNPSEKYQNTLLIKSDRIELRRYDDYKEWVDERFYNLVYSLSEKTQNYLDIFYNNIRPALLYIYNNQNKIYIRHGIETIRNSDFPITHWPFGFWNINRDTVNDIYPIEIDRFPFGIINEGDLKNNQNGYCSNHECYHSWNRIKGYITINDHKKLNGEIEISGVRDHLYAKGKIEISHWVFIVQNLLSHNDNSGAKEEDLIQLYNTLIKDNNKIITQDNVILFHKCLKLVCDRFSILNFSSI